MVRVWRLAMIAILALSLSQVVVGCSQKKPQADAAGTEVGQADKMGEGMASSEESLDASGRRGSGKYDILEGRTTAPLEPVYFDYDKSNIRADQRGRMERNAAFLKANSEAGVLVEGNCDERGTNEYNMALGERRALSAKKYLETLGVSGSKLKTISYGEEKPLLYGHDELSWAQNRRDDFVLE